MLFVDLDLHFGIYNCKKIVVFAELYPTIYVVAFKNFRLRQKKEKWTYAKRKNNDSYYHVCDQKKERKRERNDQIN